jgi:hypothetical protein
VLPNEGAPIWAKKGKIRAKPLTVSVEQGEKSEKNPEVQEGRGLKILGRSLDVS